MTTLLRKKTIFDNMKDKLFKRLFPSKHEEIMHLRTKSKLQGEHIQVLASKSIKQGRKIKDLEVLLNKIKEKETSFLKKKTQEAQNEYYKILVDSGVI